jgi:hypothetical protein
MHSPAEARGAPLRVWLERLAHLIALTLVILLLVDSLRQRSAGAEVVDQRSLAGALARWTTVRTPARVHVHLDGALSPTQRDWLAALRRVGTEVSWWGDELPALAAVASPIPDPAGATAVWSAAPSGASVVLSDAMGVLDSVRGSGAGVRFVALSAPAAVSVRATSLTASSAVRDSLVIGRVLVVGRVGWESKFVIAALEERGWNVDARLALSPRGDVAQGDATPLDTARYAAVIALDTTALRRASQIERYVRSGGGLVMEGRIAAAPGLAALSPGKLAELIAPTLPFDSVPEAPRRALGLRPIIGDSTAVVVERRDSLVAVASRRVDRGRVIVVGYEESWRWRLGGGPSALDDYREWWSAIVASVAHATPNPLEIRAVVDEAPIASLVDHLGQRAVAPAGLPHARLPRWWIFGILATLLLVEWASRRLRGVP